MGSFPILLLVDFLGCFPNLPLPPPFDSVAESLPHGKSTCNPFDVGYTSWSPSTDGERLRARFFVAKCESAVGLLCFPKPFPTAELLVGAGGREERGMETTKGLCCFGRVSAVVEDGDVVLA
jgi:hypothetical protein